MIPRLVGCLVACTFFAAALSAQCGYSPTNLVLPNTSYPLNSYNSGTTSYQATQTITAAGGAGSFTVGGTATVTFQAGTSITLLPGFTANGASGSPTFHATIAPVAQYLLTTAVSPASSGSISMSPCSANGYYSAGTVVYLTAIPGSGYGFVNWSNGSAANPLPVTMSAAVSLTANFSAGAPPPPLTLTSYGPLKGVEYFPRGHAWYSLLYDWNMDDCASNTVGHVAPYCAPGEKVYQVVQNDLQMLKANGINFIHLYIRDQDVIQDTFYMNGAPLVTSSTQCSGFVGTECPGFVGWDDGGPENSPEGQFQALQSFVSMAQANGIWIGLEFAVSRPKKEMAAGAVPATLGQNYAAWVNTFINAVQGYHNVLIWGLDWGVPGPSGDPWTSFWAAAYPLILDQVQNNPYPSGRPLLMVSSNFFSVWPDNPYIEPNLNPGYQWTTTDAEQTPAGYIWQLV